MFLKRAGLGLACQVYRGLGRRVEVQVQRRWGVEEQGRRLGVEVQGRRWKSHQAPEKEQEEKEEQEEQEYLGVSDHKLSHLTPTERLKLGYMQAASTLDSSVTPELEEEVVEGRPGRRFLLQAVLGEVRHLSRKRWPFPMPAELAVDQWRQLLDLQDARSRFDYLDLLAQEELGEQGRHSLEQILAKDRAMAEPLALPEEVLQGAVGGDEEKRRNLKVFAMQHEAARQAGSWLPWTLGPKELREIAGKRSAGQVRKYMDFLESKEEARRREFVKKRANARGGMALSKLHEVEKEEKEKEHIFYGLGANVIHLRLNKITENKWDNWNAYRAFIHSTPLVIDLSFFHQMKNRAHIKSLFYTELRNAMVFNRRALEPHALHFTNATPEIQEMLSDSFTVDCQSAELPVVVSFTGFV